MPEQDEGNRIEVCMDGSSTYASSLPPIPRLRSWILSSRFSAVLFLLVLCSFLFFYRLADRDLWSSHEARAAQDAQSILLDHQWGLPKLYDGKVELQKPPLYYWWVAAVAYVRGEAVDAWAVRLPAAIAGLGGVLLVFAWGVWRGRPLAGFVAAVVLATALHYTWLARTGRIDMPLTCTIALQLCGFFFGRQSLQDENGNRARLWLLVAYLAATAALLLKGPVGIVLPAGVALLYLAVDRELPGFRQPRQWVQLAHDYGLWWGLPLVLCLTLPWYVWANVQTGGKLFDIFFWKHNFERGFGGGALAAHPWWFYGPRLAVDFLPWSIPLAAGVWMFLRRGWWREDAEARFGLVWLFCMLVLLSCSRFKRADYLLPAYPGAALFLGSIAERWYQRASRPRVLAGAFGFILGAMSLGWGVYLNYVLPVRDSGKEYQRLAEEIRRRAPAPQMIFFFRAEAHALAFHVGRPVDSILEWENLDYWASRPGVFYVVMPAENADEWQDHLKLGQLEEVLRNTDLPGDNHVRSLVLMRTRSDLGPLTPPLGFDDD